MDNEILKSKSASAFFDAMIEEKLSALVKKLTFTSKALRTVEEVAEYLNCGEKTVRKMLKDGTLKYRVKGSGNQVSVLTSSVIKYVDYISATDFRCDDYHSNEYDAMQRGRPTLRDCERANIDTHKYHKLKTSTAEVV